jgi:UDP-N-acetylglucosamine 2-epimerase (non-hydrolysing)
MRILIPMGTRPEIVKLAPIVLSLREVSHDVIVVATGQHYDAELTEVFYDQLRFKPDLTLTLSGTDARRFGELMSGAREVVHDVRPDLVLLLGDTHTVPAFCLAARAYNRPVAHVEAGLRSFNPTSIEEVNRRVAAATASVHFAPTAQAASFLAAEGVSSERTFVVGNPICDVLRHLGVSRILPQQRNGVLLTAHRPSNVDDPDRLSELVRLVRMLAGRFGTVTFPVHPRTRSRLASAGLLSSLERGDVRLLPPLPYRQLIDVLANSAVVVTDSGGLQEEASWLGVPAVVLRRSTPRWEGVTAGTSILTGMDADRALAAVEKFSQAEDQEMAFNTECPYGDGFTSGRIQAILAEPKTADLLRLDEPDFVGQRSQL